MNHIIRSRTKASEPYGLSTLLDDFFGSPRGWSTGEGAHTPHVDILENESSYIIKADLPGIKKENIEVNLTNRVLTLKAESKSENKEEDSNGNIIRQERRFGSFMRQFALGNNISESDVTAEHVDGVLTLSIPKLNLQNKELNRIQIK
ncbi:MAG: Hsp20/alpha crystallin family protein [Pseudomonadota bacterium]